MFNEKINQITPYSPGQSIESIQQEFGLTNIIKLASNENPLGPAIDYRTCIANIDQYPDYTTHPLTQTIATKHNVATHQIILGNGSDELLQIAALACIEPGDEILSSECTFSEYKFVAQITGANYITAPMLNNAYNVTAMIDRITDRTKIIFIANPNNPTGTHINQSDVETLLKATPDKTLVVLDEAYAEYVTASDYPNSLELIKQYPNLMITRTFSKIYGLAALRVGYGIAQEHIVQNLHKVRQPFNVNGLALECAYKSLQTDDFVNQSLRVNEEGKQYLLDELTNIDCQIPDSQTNFLFIRFNESIDGLKLSQALIKRGIIVRAMKSFGQKNAIRVTIGTLEQNKRFIKELTSCLNQSLLE